MNRLLNFNPEPFETDSEVPQGFDFHHITKGGFQRNIEAHFGLPFTSTTSAALEAERVPSAGERETSPFARRRRRAPSRPTSPFARAPSALPTFNSAEFRQRIVRLATQEHARWGNGTIGETDPRLRKTLQDYWKAGAGLNYTESQLGDPAFQEAHPWSAAFISWVMKTAGAGDTFKYSASHSVYTRAAKDNRVANNNNPFKAYRSTELAPQVGDLICRSRAGSGATYDNIRPGMKTHCDIVTEVRPRKVVTIGGNVKNSVAKKILRTDADGRIAVPDYFAVIRIGDQRPSSPVVPPSPPQPTVVSAPRLLRQESTLPGTTLYVEIDLKIVDKFGIAAPSVTGIFIPDGYLPDVTVDVVLYLHGFKADAIKREAIDQYWNVRRFPYGAFREGVNASARNVVLVAPTLGSHSEAGNLLRAGGLDAYFEQVLAALRSYGLQSRSGAPLTLSNLVFACHSGGGWPMRQLAGGQDQVLAHIRECWGFDSTYNGGDDVFWAGWARARPDAKVYIYYISGSKTAPLAMSLRNMRVPNAIAQPSKEKRHNYVPMAYWQERLQGASFLRLRSGSSTPPVPPSPGNTPRTVPPPGVNYPPPAGYRVLRAPIPRDVVAKAQEILHGPNPIGTQIPVSISGNDYLFAVEWHKHAPTDPVPEALKQWHRGVTVYEHVDRSRQQPPGPSAPPGYTPSLTRLRFERAVVLNNWQQAFLDLNGLNMYEMLRALDWLSSDRRKALASQRQTFRDMANIPRIEYAMAVIETGRLPTEAPGDLAATGQVQTAAEFLRERGRRPTNVGRMTGKEFIEFVGQSARRAMEVTGVPASVTVAQAILESGWGKHTIGEAKNLFGIKGRGPSGSVRARTAEYVKGKRVMVEADFAKYESFEQSITEHARFFLRNRRYASALQFRDDPNTFAREIHKAGYATDPRYADKLIGLMRQFNLYRFDRKTSALTQEPAPLAV